MRIITIGGYGFTEKTFIAALQEANVDVFVDVRQRRGMRGSKYAFLNSTRLQSLLGAAGIRYVYARDLAPTSNVREAQKADDQTEGIAKRDRTHLSTAFKEAYRSEILSRFEPGELRYELTDVKTVALFCVEGPPTACHRLLAAEHLVHVLDIREPVEHLKP